MKRLIDSIQKIRGTVRPLSFAFTPRTARRVEAKDKRVLLAYLFPALGDSALLAPVVKSLLARGVAEPVGLLMRASAARLWKHIDLPVKIHVYPEELVHETASLREKALGTKIASALAKQLRARKYEIAVDLSFRADVSARHFVRASGAEVRLGWMATHETPESAGLFDGIHECRHETAEHWSRYLAMPLAGLGVEHPDFGVPFSVSREATSKAKALFDARPRVLLVPGSRSEAKRFPMERFAEIGRFVEEKRFGSVVVCGAPSEAELVKDLAKRIGRGAKKYTQKDLGVLLALIRGADLVVTNDTGPMHLAFLNRVPTVALFTYMSPLVWGPPVRDPLHVALKAPETGADESAHGVVTRLALHHVETLLDLRRGGE